MHQRCSSFHEEERELWRSRPGLRLPPGRTPSSPSPSCRIQSHLLASDPNSPPIGSCDPGSSARSGVLPVMRPVRSRSPHLPSSLAVGCLLRSLGRKWLSYGHNQYEVDLVLPGYEERHSTNHHGLAHGSPIAQGSTKQARFNDRPLQSRDTDDRGRDDRRKPGKSHYQPVRCKSPPISAPVSAPLLSPPPDDYLPVTIFLDQTRNRKATAPLPRPPRRTVETCALLDTGSLAGGFLRQHVVTQLQGDGLSYSAPHTKTVCSGLDSTCYSSLLLLDIRVKFLTYTSCGV
jgi:hypothetical protein